MDIRWKSKCRSPVAESPPSQHTSGSFLGSSGAFSAQLGERSHLVRLRWMEDKLYRDLGRRDEAETAFREVRDDFILQGIGLDAALVSLDLAMILLERGDTGELKRLAAEMIPVFESRDDPQKTLAAFLLFQKAAEAEQVTLGLLQEVATTLERTRRAVERS